VTLFRLSVEEHVEGNIEHLKCLGDALGAPIEARKVVSDRGIGRLDQMSLCFGFDMWLGSAKAFESQSVAGIGVGEDDVDRANCLLGQPVDCHGALYAFVADVIGDHPSLATAIGSPNYGPLQFF
jgi:hypothetical protein